MEGGVRIDDVVSFLKGPDRTLPDVLEVSMQLEINALDLYIKIFGKIEDVRAKKVFDVLIKEEKKHLSKLGKLLVKGQLNFRSFMATECIIIILTYLNSSPIFRSLRIN